MKRVNIFMDKELHAKAKVVAVLKKKSLNRYIEEAILDAVMRDKKLLEKLIK